MKFAVTIANATANAIRLQKGETLELPLTWKNADGSSRTMSGATISASVVSAEGSIVLPLTASSSTVTATVDEINMLEPGEYTLVIEESRPTDSPPTVGRGSFRFIIES